jgi:hypothetical protein
MKPKICPWVASRVATRSHSPLNRRVRSGRTRQRSPPRRQPRGKCMVSLVNSHSSATSCSICGGLTRDLPLGCLQGGGWRVSLEIPPHTPVYMVPGFSYMVHSWRVELKCGCSPNRGLGTSASKLAALGNGRRTLDVETLRICKIGFNQNY